MSDEPRFAGMRVRVDPRCPPGWVVLHQEWTGEWLATQGTHILHGELIRQAQLQISKCTGEMPSPISTEQREP